MSTLKKQLKEATSELSQMAEDLKTRKGRHNSGIIRDWLDSLTIGEQYQFIKAVLPLMGKNQTELVPVEEFPEPWNLHFEAFYDGCGRTFIE